MSCQNLATYQFPQAGRQSTGSIFEDNESGHISSADLAASITREASSQTYLTIRYLADSQRVAAAYRAYAYFRWVDDTVDQGVMTKAERLAFLAGQQEIISSCYQGKWPDGLRPEEVLVVDLIQSDQSENSGLRTYIDEMMAVMAFDAERKGRFISQVELTEYTRSLATAVTEALHYFIGHSNASPHEDTRYMAVTGAHITHMLRDTIDDAAAGYYNIPIGFLETHGITPRDVNHDAYRSWVRSQVKLARNCFAIGRTYLARVENLRCRLAGYAYIARFEVVLDAIEREGYWLRPSYPERKSKEAVLNMSLSALKETIISSLPGKGNSNHTLLPSTEIN